MFSFSTAQYVNWNLDQIINTSEEIYIIYVGDECNCENVYFERVILHQAIGASDLGVLHVNFNIGQINVS